MKKPTFFISSTIYDFSDLRSCIKYHLESNGCKVFLSEFNDFKIGFNQHSYEECLNTIETCDYFILLVGSRVGGWYDSSNKISITQQEYRKAYEQHVQGKLKIITLVRREIWQMKEDQKQLVEYLKQCDFDPSTKELIRKRPNKFAEDADFISLFLREIGRIEETKVAESEGRERPTGNWIYQFNSFKEIVDVIDGALISNVPMEDLVNKRLLKGELTGLLSQCLLKINGKPPSFPRRFVDSIYVNMRIDETIIEHNQVTIKQAHLNPLLILAYHVSQIKLHPTILQFILSSSTFLDFDVDNGIHVESEIYKEIFKLHTEIPAFNADNKGIAAMTADYSPAKLGNHENVQISTLDFLKLLTILNRWVNITERCVKLLMSLDAGKYLPPDVRAISPFEAQSELANDEIVTPTEVEQFISKRLSE